MKKFLVAVSAWVYAAARQPGPEPVAEAEGKGCTLASAL
jgi:hypothetical protein